MTKDDKTFEENLLEIENIVKELENGNVDLDKNSPLDTTVIYELLRDEIARQGLDSNSMDYVTLDEHNIPLMPAYAGLFNRKLESIVRQIAFGGKGQFNTLVKKIGKKLRGR